MEKDLYVVVNEDEVINYEVLISIYAKLLHICPLTIFLNESEPIRIDLVKDLVRNE